MWAKQDLDTCEINVGKNKYSESQVILHKLRKSKSIRLLCAPLSPSYRSREAYCAQDEIKLLFFLANYSGYKLKLTTQAPIKHNLPLLLYYRPTICVPRMCSNIGI